MTVEYEFDLMDPPFFDLEEILRWIEFTQISQSEFSEWPSMLASINLLDKTLRHGKIQAYGSIDTSPVQPIDQWMWTEFEILPSRPDGTIVHKIEPDVSHFVVRSLKEYRAAALKDLSQPSHKQVPGSDEYERGYHRVVDQVIFLEAEVRQVFPTDNVSIQTESLNDYAEALQQIEDGRYFRSHAPHSKADIARLIFDHWNSQNRKPKRTVSTIQRNVSRHYEKFGERGQ